VILLQFIAGVQTEWKLERLTQSTISVRRSFLLVNDGDWITEDDKRGVNRGRGNRLARASTGEGAGEAQSSPRAADEAVAFGGVGSSESSVVEGRWTRTGLPTPGCSPNV